MYCPGCGALRGIHDLLHGDVAGALARNPMTVLAVPYLILAVVHLGPRAPPATPPPARPPCPPWTIWLLLGVVIAFGVLRNLPGWAWLSPAEAVAVSLGHQWETGTSHRCNAWEVMASLGSGPRHRLHAVADLPSAGESELARTPREVGQRSAPDVSDHQPAGDLTEPVLAILLRVTTHRRAPRHP